MKKIAPLIIKALLILLGFFGWFLFANLILLLTVLVFKFSIDPTIISTVILLSTVIATLVLFAKKRIWVGTGIVAAVIINIGLWIDILGGLSNFFWENILLFAGTPLPLGTGF